MVVVVVDIKVNDVVVYVDVVLVVDVEVVVVVYVDVYVDFPQEGGEI